jgi:hypothetical protein
MRNRWLGILFAVCGIALVAWVLWDAGSVQQHLPFGARMDEASVALLALALGGALLALAIHALRRRAAFLLNGR